MSKRLDSGPEFPEQLTAGNTLLQQDKDIYEQQSTANVENFVGTARIPVGLAGPVTVNGDHAQGTFYIPMATTEGTLVASTTRGMKVINECGGIRVKMVRNGGIQRAPVFEFNNIDDAFEFTQALNDDWSWLTPIIESTTSHGKLTNILCWQMGTLVCIRITMNPGDASGQNMVSIAAAKGVEALLEKYPQVKRFRMGGGLSGEKMPSNVNILLGRGKSVTANVSIPAAVMQRITRADIADIPRLHQSYSNFALWAGNMSSHNALPNTLTAIYIATGQDVATLPECSQAQNLIEYDHEQQILHWQVHIPNLTAGTVGGGTGLPTQRECLELMDCHGNGKVNKFVELCAVAALANEISFWGAMCAQEWISAHASLRTR